MKVGVTLPPLENRSSNVPANRLVVCASKGPSPVSQVVRDLRTLREAALILDGNKHTAECQRLVTVVRELVADPKRTIETSSDTDEDKAEALDKTRRPKTAALKNAAQ